MRGESRGKEITLGVISLSWFVFFLLSPSVSGWTIGNLGWANGSFTDTTTDYYGNLILNFTNSSARVAKSGTAYASNS